MPQMWLPSDLNKEKSIICFKITKCLSENKNYWLLRKNAPFLETGTWEESILNSWSWKSSVVYRLWLALVAGGFLHQTLTKKFFHIVVSLRRMHWSQRCSCSHPCLLSPLLKFPSWFQGEGMMRGSWTSTNAIFNWQKMHLDWHHCSHQVTAMAVQAPSPPLLHLPRVPSTENDL